MSETAERRCTAFAGDRRIASGVIGELAVTVKRAIDGGLPEIVLIFDDRTGRPVDIDFRGTEAEMLGRLAGQASGPAPAAVPDGAGDGAAARRPGRPKLGVVAREVTLLPRHWDWLAGQPGGASVALRKLVDEARQASRDKDRARLAREAADRFMAAMAGDRPGFEEATRALYAGDGTRFDHMVQAWPADVRDYAWSLAAAAF